MKGFARYGLPAAALCLALCLAGCAETIQALQELRDKTASSGVQSHAASRPERQETSPEPAPAPETTGGQSGSLPQTSGQGMEWDSCRDLRDWIEREGKMAGVAFIGYADDTTPEEYVNLLEWRGYLEAYDFLLKIPANCLVQAEKGYQLYCILPGPSVAVTVREWMGSDIFGDDTGTAGEVLYASDSGEPVLLLCGHDLIQPNLQVTLEDNAGNTLVWLPRSTDDGLPYLGKAEQGLLDFTPITTIPLDEYDRQLATPEILQGEWMAWDAHTREGQPQVCSLCFYPDQGETWGMEYFYGPPGEKAWFWFEGEFIPSAAPVGWITEDMSEFSMELVGGIALETGLPPAYEGQEISRGLNGVYNIYYYPDLDVIEVVYQFGQPLLEEIGSITFERSSG